jgi:hypothetical protein
LQQRTFAEEISIIESMGGENDILDKLRTDRKHGIKSENIPNRVEYFGSNRKAAAKLKTFW